MNKITKIALVTAGVMAGIGVVCMIISWAMGMTGEQYIDMVEDGKFSFSFGGSKVDQETEAVMEINDKCSCVEVELSAGSMEIYYGDVESLQIEHEGVNGFEAYVKDETLHIEDDGKLKNNEGTIIVVVPKDMRFVEVDLEIGAGEADIDGVIADKVSIEVGAGQANVLNLDAEKLDVEVGTGQLCVELAGNMNDYNYELECGIGEIIIGENSYSGLGSSRTINNIDSVRNIKAECGVGQIQIDFAE